MSFNAELLEISIALQSEFILIYSIVSEFLTIILFQPSPNSNLLQLQTTVS